MDDELDSSPGMGLSSGTGLGGSLSAGGAVNGTGRMTPPIPERAPSPSRSRSLAFSFRDVDENRGQDNTLLQLLGGNYWVDTGYPYLAGAQHEHNAIPSFAWLAQSQKWRVKERMKTASVALVVCLNIGVDPPDIVKTKPCAKLECWFDPLSMAPQKAIENIGKALQAQYERWQPRARYKSCLDPTIEEVKKMCVSLRRNSKDERILFHYNGHGVPKPTTNGEIWVFNKNFTQYIPLSIYDLQSWMASPSIFVYDCSAAGNIIQSFHQFAEQREREFERLQTANPNSTNQQVLPMRDCIQLAACRANEILPMNPNLPADLFSACLTTPIEIAIRWFVLHNSMLNDLSLDVVDKIPGRLNDRRTPLGELNWIFTAITDTIAWNVLPRELFQKLFRQDLLVASLFRNFLLAERIMRSYNCTPLSSPKLPLTHQHAMWNAWDLAADMCLSQLPGLLDGTHQYSHSPFFSEQLTAFEVWLEHGNDRKRPPEQLPIVLQVLLSQAHRLRALRLLAQFLDLGAWAVNLALSVGIFPYVLKLLQSPAAELRQVLVHIWAKILAVDRSCQADLVKDNGYKYFIMVLWNTSIPSEERAMAAFVLAMVCREHRLGQQACLGAGIIAHCLGQLSDPNPLLRQWLCLCLAEIWSGFADAKKKAINDRAQEHLQELFSDPCPLVRAASVYALGRFIGDLERNDHTLNFETTIGISLLVVTADAAPLVRRELVIALSAIVHQNEAEFRFTANQLLDEEMRRSMGPLPSGSSDSLRTLSNDYFGSSQPLRGRSSVETASSSAPVPVGLNSSHLAVYQCIWKILLSLAIDPFNDVAEVAQAVVDAIFSQMMQAIPTDKRPTLTAKAPPPLSPSPAKRSTSTAFRVGFGEGKASQRTASTDNVMPPPRSPRTSSQATLRAVTLPLLSVFFDWSAEQFARPPVPASLVEQPGSEANLAREWRRKRNLRVINEARPIQAISATKKLEEQVHILDNESELVWLLRFHSYEPRLVVADGRDGISVWDLINGTKIHTFANQIPSTSARLTALGFINEEDDALLMTGSDDGVIRFWRDYDNPKKVETVSAWRALTDLLPSSRGSGLVTEWQQRSGSLLVSGDVRVVRIWDMEREFCVQDIPTFSDSCVTTLTSDKIRGDLLIAGCGDGAIRLYDRRQPSRDSMVRAMVEHRGWVVNALLHKLGDSELITGSVAGDIKFWDLRMNHSVKTIEAHANGMSAMAVHNHAPIIASGSHNQYVKVYSMDGTALSTIRYHDGFLGQRIGPISAMTFHPHKMLLAAGSTDSIISIFETDTRT